MADQLAIPEVEKAANEEAERRIEEYEQLLEEVIGAVRTLTEGMSGGQFAICDQLARLKEKDIPGRNNGIKEDLQRAADESGLSYDTCRAWRDTGLRWTPDRRQSAVDNGVPFNVFVELRNWKEGRRIKLEGLTVAAARAKAKGNGRTGKSREPKFRGTQTIFEEWRLAVGQVLRDDDPLAHDADALLEADDMPDIYFKVIEDTLTSLRDRTIDLLAKFQNKHAQLLEKQQAAEAAEEAVVAEREGENIDFLSATAKGVNRAKSQQSSKRKQTPHV
jgi:hypothetical protein